MARVAAPGKGMRDGARGGVVVKVEKVRVEVFVLLLVLVEKVRVKMAVGGTVRGVLSVMRVRPTPVIVSVARVIAGDRARVRVVVVVVVVVVLLVVVVMAEKVKVKMTVGGMVRGVTSIEAATATAKTAATTAATAAVCACPAVC